MEFIRRNSDYALRSLVYMAKFPQGEKLTIKRISQKQNLPLIFLSKIFQKLSRKKIVRSHRGRKGGFYLLKNPSKTSLREILESVQGRISLSDCLFETNSCRYAKSCQIRGELTHLQKKLIRLLEKYTLHDFLISEAKKQ